MAAVDCKVLKRCSRCGETKPLTEFHKNASRSDGVAHACAPCGRAIRIDYYAKNRDQVKAQIYSARKLDPDRFKKIANKCREKNRETFNARTRAYCLANAEALRVKRIAKYYEKKEERRPIRTRMMREKRRGDPFFRMVCGVRRSTHYAFSRMGYTKKSRCHAILGCDWEFLKGHIEGQFSEGMTFENYGRWHVDHITPLASAKNEDDVLRLCHYSNLQPLWAEDNQRKGALIAAT